MAKDKQLHLIAGALIALITMALTMPFIGETRSAWAGFYMGTIAGLFKEVYDYFNQENHTPEFADAFVTIIGAAIGSGGLYLLRLWIHL